MEKSESKEKKRFRNTQHSIGSSQTTVSVHKSIKSKNWQDGSIYSNSNLNILTLDLRNSEKEVKSLISRQKQIKRNFVDNMHNTLLRENYDSNFKTIYLTDQKDKLSMPVINLKREVTSNEPKSDRENFSKLKSCNYSTITENKPSKLRKFERLRINSPNVTRVYKSLLVDKRETNQQFLEATRHLCRSKYLIEFKKEIAVRLNEDIDNDMGEINEKLFSSKENGNFLLHTDEKYSDYVKFLFNQKENEKAKLEDLVHQQHTSGIEMKNYQHLISKLKVTYDRYIDYRNFLVCVKERNLVLPQHYLAKIAEDNPNEKFYNFVDKVTNKKPKKPEKSLKLSSLSSLKPKRYSKSTIYTAEELEKDAYLREIVRYARYLEKPVYSNHEDFLQDIDTLEKENLALLEKYNEYNAKILNLEEEYDKLKLDEKNQQEFYHNNILKREKKLKELILKNRKLNDEKNKLYNDYPIPNLKSNNINSPSKQNTIDKKFLQIFNSIIKELPDDFYERNKLNNKVEKQSITDISSDHFKLKEIERILNCLLDKYWYYKSNKEFNKKLLDYEIKTEKIRKIIKNKEMRSKDELKRDILRKIVLDKESNFVILPKRRVVFRYKPFKSNDNVEVETVSHLENEFDKYIEYGEDNL